MAENTNESKARVISNEDYFAEVQRILREGKEVRIRVKGNSMRPFIQLDGKEGEAIVIAIMGLIETVSTAASKNQIDALTAQQVMENSLLVILQDYSAT